MTHFESLEQIRDELWFCISDTPRTLLLLGHLMHLNPDETICGAAVALFVYYLTGDRTLLLDWFGLTNDEIDSTNEDRDLLDVIADRKIYAGDVLEPFAEGVVMALAHHLNLPSFAEMDSVI